MVHNFDSTSKKLLTAPLAESLQVAMDLRERIEIVHTSEYSNFLAKLFPAFKVADACSRATHTLPAADRRRWP